MKNILPALFALGLSAVNLAANGAGVCESKIRELGNITMDQHFHTLHQQYIAEARTATESGELQAAYDAYQKVLGSKNLGLATVAARCGQAGDYRLALEERKRLGLIIARDNTNADDPAAVSLLIDSLNSSEFDALLARFYRASPIDSAAQVRDLERFYYELDTTRDWLSRHPGQVGQQDKTPQGLGRFETEINFLNNIPQLRQVWLQSARQFQQRLVLEERQLADAMLRSDDPVNLAFSRQMSLGDMLRAAQRWETMIAQYDVGEGPQLQALAERQADQFTDRAGGANTAGGTFSVVDPHAMIALDLYKFAGREDKVKQFEERAAQTAEKQAGELAEQYEKFRKELPTAEEQAQSKAEADSLADELGL